MVDSGLAVTNECGVPPGGSSEIPEPFTSVRRPDVWKPIYKLKTWLYEPASTASNSVCPEIFFTFQRDLLSQSIQIHIVLQNMLEKAGGFRCLRKIVSEMVSYTWVLFVQRIARLSGCDIAIHNDNRASQFAIPIEAPLKGAECKAEEYFWGNGY